MAPHAAASGGTPATPAGIDKGGSAGSSDARCTGRDPVAHSAVNGRKRLKRVAIIGGGSAGIVQAQQLHQLSHAADSEVAFETTIYERRPKLGAGLWMCDQETGECVIRWDEHGRGWPTSGPSEGTGEGEEDRRWPIGAMYEGLRTNIPCDLMSYRDYPFPPRDVSGAFPSRSEVEEYLIRFAADCEESGALGGDIRLNTAVTKLRRLRGPAHDDGQVGDGSTWQIESLDLEAGARSIDEYDCVVIANGRCNVPSLPPIPGLWNFTSPNANAHRTNKPSRKLLHSAWYRTPHSFSSCKRVVIVGNSSSGMDVARELRGYIVRSEAEILGGRKEEWIQKVRRGEGPEVINSIEDLTKPPAMDYDPLDEHSPAWSKGIKVVPRIRRVEKDGILLLEDETRLEDVDAIVFATGFNVSYEFVDYSEEPFGRYPLVPTLPKREIVRGREEEEALQQARGEAAQGHDAPPHTASLSPWSTPCAPGPANLDDWLLLYSPDDSLGILGLPTGVVPFVFTHAQARYIASYWAGKARKLPALSRSLAMNDPERWKSRISKDVEEGERDDSGVRGNQGPMPLVFGSPSDFDYVDALLEHIDGAGEEPPAGQGGEHNGASATAEELPADAAQAERYWRETTEANLREGREEWYRVKGWRRARRKENKTLRRLTLGY